MLYACHNWQVCFQIIWKKKKTTTIAQLAYLHSLISFCNLWILSDDSLSFFSASDNCPSISCSWTWVRDITVQSTLECALSRHLRFLHIAILTILMNFNCGKCTKWMVINKWSYAGIRPDSVTHLLPGKTDSNSLFVSVICAIKFSTACHLFRQKL